MRRSVAVLVAAGVGTATVALGPAGPAGAAGGCPQGGVRAGTATAGGVPWAQRRYGLERLDGIVDGTGVTVAVLDSGVDAHHPSLRGRVLPGLDLLRPPSPRPGRVRCAGSHRARGCCRYG